MQKTIKISRADLENGKFKKAKVENFGVEPTNRDVKLISKILNKCNKKGKN